MPKFIDHHAKLPPKTPEEVEMMKAFVREGKPDAFGTKILEGYFTATGGGYCVCEAPNADSVVKSHEAMGVPLDKSAVEEIAGTLT